MRLLRTILIGLSMMCFAASTASAIEFNVLGATTVTIYQGGSFSISIALENASATSNNGVIGRITGLAAAGAIVTSGVSADQHFVQSCGTQCLGGIVSNPNPFFDPTDLSQSGAYTPGDDSVTIVSALSFPETTGTGALDPGLAGVIGSHDPNDVFITFTADTLGSHLLTIGGEFSQSGEQLITSTATFTVNVIPEPGTALLTGLGLAGLAAAGRRRA